MTAEEEAEQIAKLEGTAFRGSEVQRLMDIYFAGAVATYRLELVNNLLNHDPDDVKSLTEFRHQINALKKVEAKLTSLAERGRLAEYKLKSAREVKDVGTPNERV